MRLQLGTLVLLWLAASQSATGQTFTLQRPDPISGAATEILGGTKSDPADWPATFVFKSADKKGCTATAVGPRVFLTAGHCITGGSKGSLEHTKASLACETHDWYNSGSNYDVALCLSTIDIVLEEEGPFESLDLGHELRLKDPVTLLGYGCTTAGGDAGTLYQGASRVERAAGGTRTFFEAAGGAALCAGDSGGGAYRLAGASSRRIVAVASATVLGGPSLFASLADPDTARFVREWANRQVDGKTGQKLEVRICGIDDLDTCHS